MKHKKRAVMTVVLCFVLMINGFTNKVQASNADTGSKKTTQKEAEEEWPQGPEITAGAAVVMDAETGLVLYEKNSTKKRYPASITKILTALVAAENSSLSDTVTFTKNAVFSIEKGSSSCAFDWGEEVSLEDCLYGLMLESGNDAANGIAEHVGGSIENFIDMMNAKAKELGCENSHFNNAHGLSDENHYTCAYDMALIAKAAIRNTDFATIVSTRRHEVEPTNKQPETRYFINHHKFIRGDYSYDGCIGGKTGWTTASRYTLVTYAERNNMTLVCVIMDEADAKAQYTETAKLLDYGFDNFSILHLEDTGNNDLIEEEAFFSKYDTVLSKDSPLLSMSEDGYVILPHGVDLEETQRTIQYEESKSEDDGSTIKTIGTVTYRYLDKVIGQANILLNLTGSQLPTTIHQAIEPSTEKTESNEDRANMSEGTAVENSSSNEKTEKKKPDLKPVIILVIVGTITILAVAYYFTVERPRIRRRKAYLERRKNHRYH